MDTTDGVNFAIHVGTAVDHCTTTENIRVFAFRSSGNRSAGICLYGTEALDSVSVLCGSYHSGTDANLHKSRYPDALAQIRNAIINRNGKRGVFTKEQVAVDSESFANSGTAGGHRSIERSALFEHSVAANTDSGAVLGRGTVMYRNGCFVCKYQRGSTYDSIYLIFTIGSDNSDIG